METSDSEYFESADEDFESDVEDKSQKEVIKVPTQEKITEPELRKLKLEDISDPLLEKDNTPQSQTDILNKEDYRPVSETINQSTDTTVSESLPEIEKPCQPKVEEKEENLWDDDELDWGSEAAKEVNTPKSDNDNGWNDFDADWDSQSQSQSQTVVNNSDTLKNSSTQENLWQDDGEWEPLEKPPTTQESTWGGWGGWGVTSLLNSATQSVTTLTSQVSQVLESSIGIPQPEELAKINAQQEQVETETDSAPLGTFGLGSLVKFVESTGTKVISGGLDTLEAIGKKTVEVLQDGDPGLKKKRAFLKLDTMGKPNLSQILREAKEKAEQEPEKLQETKKIKNYETLFDDHQGLVHLEALEMLSKLCSIKLDNLKNSLSADSLREMQETLEQVNELCELSEDDEDEKVTLKEAGETVSNAVQELNIPITYAKFFEVCEEANHWLDIVKSNLVDDVDIYQQAMDTLAQLTAICMEQYHKAGELLMVKEHRSTADEADSLVQITTITKRIILEEAEKFTEKLSSIQHADKDRISDHITNIFFEAGNSSTYIQNAFQLLIPVLQVGAV